MSNIIQAIRGMNDILPADVPYWHTVEMALFQLTEQYGYHEIRFPLVEKTQLFKRTIGEVTDIVEKEMYVFEDRNGDSLALRPEGTAGCIRAGIEHGLLHNQTQKLWYFGPMYRHERPQKGRYRQFYQFGLEAIGFAGPDVDAEMIAFSARLWRQLGIADKVTLQINSLGTAASRAQYREQLVAYLQEHADQLDADSQRRLDTNPLRILDSKNPDMQAMLSAAPQLMDHLDEESQQHFAQLCQLLDAMDINYEVNPRLVRGLDYYGKTVFEWVTTELGAQGTVCAGGRYDGLVEQLGGKATPAVGFSIGLERVILLLQEHNASVENIVPDAYVMVVNAEHHTQVMALVEQWRDEDEVLRFHYHCGGGSLKSQFKRADKSGAHVALVFGEEEMANRQVTVKWLREDKPQEIVDYDNVVELLIENQ